MEIVRNTISSVSNTLGESSLVRIMHVKIRDIDARVSEMIDTIRDTCWLEGMESYERVAFEARMTRTVRKFVNMLSDVEGGMNTSIGEIMISDTAQKVLVENVNHTKIPLADLIKERVQGNGGFDFHTESNSQLIVYGEAKYSGVSTKYTEAISQINDFIGDLKDSAELIDLKYFVSQEVCDNAVEGRRGYTAAFSMICDNPNRILSNALNSEQCQSLIGCAELYLIGVEIDVE
ncbi:hypothetical protein SAMN02745751_03408 [Dethiosulfatibacter aminovorans DSM 17477]|uniref:Anti-bacteriophage protein A/HamA C-terminal domain-containing protein n=1 Tax=Dethiosulfatibacter aminovorans DSM 17477 TaxID=1121476 RepID=A0A1M6M9M1_9FIRM|nr:hypothetical protein [Dethiosulfatibacter aminovorans]SHJ80114.1 hypothetical protein SAMN02745751_03408 [Dethiosulfatibacter aminovorans DSM 17477]